MSAYTAFVAVDSSAATAGDHGTTVVAAGTGAGGRARTTPPCNRVPSRPEEPFDVHRRSHLSLAG